MTPGRGPATQDVPPTFTLDPIRVGTSSGSVGPGSSSSLTVGADPDNPFDLEADVTAAGDAAAIRDHEIGFLQTVMQERWENTHVDGRRERRRFPLPLRDGPPSGDPQSDPPWFARFARAAARHFAGRVDRYAIWNEPNWSAWLAPTKSAPQLYRSLYRAGYTAVKTVDPNAQVLFGELAPNRDGRTIAPLKFLRDMFKGAKPMKADGFAMHPYQLTSAPSKIDARKPDDVTIGTLPRLTTALDALYKAHKLQTPKGRKLDLYLTEFGYLTAGTRKQPQSRIASWLVAAIDVARKNKRVKQLLHYQLVDPPKTALWHSALLTRKGAPQAAYKALVRALNP